MDELREPKKPSAVIRQAICLIEKLGWCREKLWNFTPDGTVAEMCALGAIEAARQESLDKKNLDTIPINILGSNYPTKETADIVREAGYTPRLVFDVNDKVGKEEVLKLLTAMASKLEAKGR